MVAHSGVPPAPRETYASLRGLVEHRPPARRPFGRVGFVSVADDVRIVRPSRLEEEDERCPASSTTSLGDCEVPAEAYYGVQTLRGAENFPITGLPIPTPRRSSGR